MLRTLTALALMFASPALAQPKPAPVYTTGPSLNYKVSMGGLNTGTFSTWEIPSLSISLQANDVIVLPTTNAVDKRPIKLLNGKVSSLAQKILKDKIGQQMTITVQIMPLGVKPGKRCKVLMDHAFLKGMSAVSFTLEASGVPKIQCTGTPKL